MKGHYGTRIVH